MENQSSAQTKLPRVLYVEDNSLAAALVNMLVYGICELEIAIDADDALQKI